MERITGYGDVTNALRFTASTTLCAKRQHQQKPYRLDVFFILALWARQHAKQGIYFIIARPHSMVLLQHSPSVRPSVTRWYCVKTAEHIVESLSPSASPVILVFYELSGVVNPLTPTDAMGTAIKHPVPDQVKPSFPIFDRAERQSARMSKITNDGLTRSDTGCFIAVPLWQKWA